MITTDPDDNNTLQSTMLNQCATLCIPGKNSSFIFMACDTIRSPNQKIGCIGFKESPLKIENDFL